MRIAITKSKNFEFIYIQKDFYNNGARTTKVIKKLGRLSDLMDSMNLSREQVILWAKQEALRLTQEEKINQENVLLSLSCSHLISNSEHRLFAAGYLFLQQLYARLNLKNLLRNMKSRHHYEFDLDAILSDLVYARILHPCSKRASYKTCQSFLEPPKYQPHDVYRALSILALESEAIQSELYKNSQFITPRNQRVLYYDCTNYYFEIEQEDTLRKYGKSKEHRPNPIVQMGLFMDGNGLPLAFDLFPGNQNEQPSLRPLEQTIIRDFDLSEVIVCTDAGLASLANKRFNHIQGRAFITTQSLKKLKKQDKQWALSPSGWRRLSNHQPIPNLQQLDDADFNSIFYKEAPYETHNLEQRLIVTYSPKHAHYQRSIREAQIERAIKMMNQKTLKKQRKNPHDPSRFIKTITTTCQGEVANQSSHFLDEQKIQEEAQYDGYYGIVTDLLDDEIQEILAVSQRRWEIEESFRIMKTDFTARPVYLQREDRIKAHFLICFMALLIYRLLEQQLGKTYTITEILDTLNAINLTKLSEGYISSFNRTELTDKLHDLCSFRLNYEIIKPAKMKNIIKQSKNNNLR